MKSWAAMVLLSAACLLGAGVSGSVIRGVTGKVSGGTEKVNSYVEAAGQFLGPLRPLLVDFLWLRSIQAQDDRRYYEAYTMSYMILRLEPRYAPVWDFAGWNLAYNISWDQVTPEDRYRWIMDGIETLRQGARRNPGAIDIYAQLAHTYSHRLAKVGGDPYQTYFEEYLSPPADWTKRLGLEYRGESVMLAGGKELRLYEGAAAGGIMAFGLYPPGGNERAPFPYGVFYRPADGRTPTKNAPPAFAKIAPGVNLWEAPDGGAPTWFRPLEKYPDSLENAWVYRYKPPVAPDGRLLPVRTVTADFPTAGTAWVGFPPDRMACLRRAAAIMEEIRKRRPFTAYGMDGLNLGRQLAHTYERMGQFVEAESVWRELLAGVGDRFRRGVEEGVVHFYGRVLNYFERIGDIKSVGVWRRKKAAAMNEVRFVGRADGTAATGKGVHHEK